MNNHLGNILVLLALLSAGFGAVIGIVTGVRNAEAGAAWVRRCTWGFFAGMLGANLAMINALVTHDFSVKYVAQVGSRDTPLVYTIVSLWSALEGSILFWGAILAGFLLAFERVHRKEPARYVTPALGVMLAVSVFFAFLIAGPANPFGVVSPVPFDGPGPNPLLQNHILMVVHPPMLYLGYAGMTVPFGVAVAALLRGEITETWMGPLRRWTMVAWFFLTVGIVLGAWWAYAVLGWGGYWSWDPVENASFLPWLTATAFMHSTMVQERRKMLKLWTVALALVSFILVILGTFMTRSGVFNSVHAFTQSEIGPTFLAFLAVLLVVSVALLTARGHLLVAEDRVPGALSRETTILVNNLVFVALTFTVLLGTLYPLISEALRGERVSVGEPYFNKMAVPTGVAILFLMGVGPGLPWGAADPRRVRQQFLVPAAAGLLTVVACLAFGLRGFWPLTTFGLAAFVTMVTLRDLALPVQVRMRERKESFGTALLQSAGRARRRFGGYIVHLGVVMVFVAIAASQNYVQHSTRTLKRGESMAVGRYNLTYNGLVSGEEPHRSFIAAKVDVSDGAAPQGTVLPRLNYYERSNDPIGTPAVTTGPREDLYISLLAFNQDGGSASFNTWVFPLVGWIWWSLPFFALGTLISLWPQRRARVAVPAGAAAPAAAGAAREAQRGAA